MNNKFFKEKDKEVMKYRFEQPKKAYDICIEILRHGESTLNWYEVAYAYMYMGDTLLTMGKASEAIDSMLKAEAYEKQYGYDELLMKNYNILGVAYMIQSDDLLALDNWLLSLAVAQKLDDYVYMGALYNNIGAIFHNRGDIESAVPFFEKGIEIAKKNNIEDENLIYNEGKMETNITASYIKSEEYIKAKEHLDKGVELLGGKMTRILKLNINSMYAHIYYNFGDNVAAYEACKYIIGRDISYYEDIEAFDYYIEIIQILIKIERYKEVKDILDILVAINNKEYNASRKINICQQYIELFKATKDKDKLNYWYREYYKSRQDIRKEEYVSVITALDNRKKLENEKIINNRLQKDNIELIKESEYDELTELRNRYGIKKYFASIYETAKEKNENICVVMIDVDYFKLYNDTYGHLAGDECLRRVADIIRKNFEDDYYVARYGGDEFFVMAKNKAYEDIDIVLKHLINDVMQAKIKFESHPESDVVTVSVGAVNVVAHEGYEISDFIHEADNMLYKVKENGRKGYCIADNI